MERELRHCRAVRGKPSRRVESAKLNEQAPCLGEGCRGWGIQPTQLGRVGHPDRGEIQRQGRQIGLENLGSGARRKRGVLLR